MPSILLHGCAMIVCPGRLVRLWRSAGACGNGREGSVPRARCRQTSRRISDALPYMTAVKDQRIPTQSMNQQCSNHNARAISSSTSARLRSTSLSPARLIVTYVVCSREEGRRQCSQKTCKDVHVHLISVQEDDPRHLGAMKQCR